jgi:pimeloyl-ACP methyl ester carboxylesterase
MDFQKDGLLTPGVHETTGRQFIEVFCQKGERSHFAKAVQDLCDFASARGGNRILVGGSFVSRAKTPHDLDCVIVFEKVSQIPDRAEQLQIGGTSLDIFFCAEDQPAILGAFLKMFSRNRSDNEVGVVQINLFDERNRPLWQVVQEPDDRTLEIIKRAYFQRHIVERNNRHKAIITIHGIRSHGEWNAEITHIASSNGWIVAPFVYGYVDIDIFRKSSKRREIIDRFRDHLEEMRSLYECDVSVIAHSMGTYIAASYLYGFDLCPHPLDTLILTGSILNEKLDINALRGNVAKIINEVAPNDPVVKYAKAASLWRDPLLGRSGDLGFTQSSLLLQQQSCNVFDHNNVIRKDVVSRRWMPWLEANVGKGQEASMEVLTERLKKNQKVDLSPKY